MNEKTLKDLLSSLKTAGKPKTSAYDTTATVTRVEGGTAWVHIPGGVTETPVKLTISAKAGDNVQVRVSGGRAFMVGNASAPPTDDTVATGAVRQISTVRKVVERVREVAETASRIAGNTNQYFWHTQEGTDTGAHITEIPQEEFLADPANGGGNLLARSNGIAVRDGLTELATFGANGIKIGCDGEEGIRIAPDYILLYDPNGDQHLRIYHSTITAPDETTRYNTVLTNAEYGSLITLDPAIDDDSGHFTNELSFSARMKNYAFNVGVIKQLYVGQYSVDIYGGSGKLVQADWDGNLEASGKLTAGAVTSYTPSWATNQSPANYHCVVSAGLCSFFYQGSGGTHSNETLLGTLPTGAKPKSIVFCPCVKGANAYGLVKIETNGNIYLAYISSTSATARLYFNCSFPVV